MTAGATSRDASSSRGRARLRLRSLSNGARAALVAFAWIVGALPAMLGLSRCPSARLFHVACPGCGMTRACWLFLRGDFAASFAMHPLAVPIALATALVALATVVATYVHGTPVAVVESRAGRAAIALFVALQVASIVLWALRAFGMFGGSVPIG